MKVFEGTSKKDGILVSTAGTKRLFVKIIERFRIPLIIVESCFNEFCTPQSFHCAGEVVRKLFGMLNKLFDKTASFLSQIFDRITEVSEKLFEHLLFQFREDLRRDAIKM